MAFIKISEQPSLYNDLEKKSVREILEDINTEDQKVALAVQKAIPQIEKLVTQIVPRMKQGGRIFYMGAGTSGRLGVLDASEIPPTFGMPNTLVIGLIAGGDTALRNPVENAEDDIHRGWEELVERNITTKDTVIGIAASGTTPYVIGALHEAREHGILTACITSNPDSPMAAEADVPIEMIVGPEYVTGSSRMKSGTGQKMIQHAAEQQEAGGPRHPYAGRRTRSGLRKSQSLVVDARFCKESRRCLSRRKTITQYA